MKKKYDIDRLLEKYFEGESSLEEEKILRCYFSQKSVSEEHMQYAALFQYLNEEQTKQVNFVLDKKKGTNRIKIGLKVGIAASMALILALGISQIYLKSNNDQTMAYIDGHRISDIGEINSQAMISLSNVSDIDTETIDSQINILDSFIE